MSWWRVISIGALGVVGIGVVGCQRDRADADLGEIVTDLSHVPGADTPYELPELEASAAEPPAKQDHAGHDHHNH